VQGVWEHLKQEQILEIQALKDSHAQEFEDLKTQNQHLQDKSDQFSQRLQLAENDNQILKAENTQLSSTLNIEKEARLLAQRALDRVQIQFENQDESIEALKESYRLSLCELKETYSSDLAALKEGLNVAKDAMEDYRTRYAVDVDNLKIKNEQLEKQVFDLALARRDSESLKQRLKVDLELSQKELDSLRQEDKLNKNTKVYLEEELKSSRAEIARLNRLLEALHHRQSAEVEGFSALSKRLLNIEKKFEKIEE
jgi:chromosome segregation ATPase